MWLVINVIMVIFVFIFFVWSLVVLNNIWEKKIVWNVSFTYKLRKLEFFIFLYKYNDIY